MAAGLDALDGHENELAREELHGLLVEGEGGGELADFGFQDRKGANARLELLVVEGLPVEGRGDTGFL